MEERSTVSQVQPSPTMELAGARLLVLNGPDRARALQLNKEDTTIGTSVAADLRLADAAVSRLHAAIVWNKSEFLLLDLDSTNGTRVGKQRIKSVFLDFGDVIAMGSTRLRFETSRRRVDLPLSMDERFGTLWGRSSAARRLFALLEQVAARDTTVLLLGETGVGKDACAESLHGASARAGGPFVVVDCAALPAGIAESELFGHVKGAFTGAHHDRPGAFVEADGGTLFIDEIGELPRALQPKLLRALERREVRPVGADRPIAVDVRIIAATHRDLRREVNRGTFREDLFYRLNVVSIVVPPLRQRIEDIPLLADLFWRRITGDGDAECPPQLLRALCARRWPGNVRELYNKIEEVVALNKLELSEEPERAPQLSYRQARQEALDRFQQEFLAELMVRAKGKIAEAARLAAMDRPYLHQLLQRYGLRIPPC